MTNKRELTLTVLAAICTVAVVLAGCASGGKAIRFPLVEDQMEVGDYAAAYTDLERQRDYYVYSEYKANNDISYQLDRGFLAHYSGDYTDSNGDLHEAERLIEEAWTRSISQNISKVTKNDPYQADYIGEDYENIYINVFSALNYYNMGQIESAQVEIRRMNEKMQYYADLYEDMMVEIGSKDWRSKVSGEATYFYKSALAGYMGMLFWRGMGNMDSARIDAQSISEAYRTMPNVYLNPLPKELVMRGNVNDETEIPNGMARLNFISFTGLSPLKTLGMGMVPRRSPVTRIEVVFSDGKKMELSLLESISNTVYQVQRTRAYYESAMKELMRAFGEANAVMEIVFNGVFAPAILAVNLATYNSKKGPEYSAHISRDSIGTDLRMGRFMPGNAWVGGINLPPGQYSFTVNYYSGNKVIDSQRVENRTVSAGKLNLVEGFNLKHDYTITPNTLALEGDKANFLGLSEMSEWGPAKTLVSVLTKGSWGSDYDVYQPMPNFPGRLPAPNVQAKVTRTYMDDYIDYVQTDDFWGWKQVVTKEEYQDIEVTWDPIPGAAYYWVYEHVGNRDDFFNSQTAFAGKPFFEPGFTAKERTDYNIRYRVIAFGNDGWGVPCAPIVPKK